jgi:hypothetical protein
MPYSLRDVSIEMNGTGNEKMSMDAENVRQHLLADVHPAPVRLYPNLTPETGKNPILSATVISDNKVKLEWTGGHIYGAYQIRGRYKNFDGTWSNITSSETITNGIVYEFSQSAAIRNTMYGVFEIFIVLRFATLVGGMADFLPSNTITFTLRDWEFATTDKEPILYGADNTHDSDYPNWKTIGYRYDMQWLVLALWGKGIKSSEIGGSILRTDWATCDISVRRNITIYCDKTIGAVSKLSATSILNGEYYPPSPGLTIGLKISEVDFTFVFSGSIIGSETFAVKDQFKQNTAYVVNDTVDVDGSLYTCIRDCTNILPGNNVAWGKYWIYSERNPAVPLLIHGVHSAKSSKIINNGTIRGGGGGGGYGGNTVLWDAYYFPNWINKAYTIGATVTHLGELYYCKSPPVAAYFNGAFTYSVPLANGSTLYWQLYSENIYQFNRGSDGLQGGIAIKNDTIAYISIENNGIIHGGGNGGGGGRPNTIPIGSTTGFALGQMGTNGRDSAGGDGGKGAGSSLTENNPNINFKYKGDAGGLGSDNSLLAGEDGQGPENAYAFNGKGGAAFTGQAAWGYGRFTVIPGGKPYPPLLKLVPDAKQVTVNIIALNPLGGNTPAGYKIYCNNVYIGNTVSNSFIAPNLAPNSVYTFYAIAYNGVLESIKSSTYSVRTKLNIPIFNIINDGFTYNSFGVEIIVEDPADKYEVYINEVLVTTLAITGAATLKYLTGPTMDMSSTYYIKVKAFYSSVNESFLSPQQAVTTTYAAVPQRPYNLEVIQTERASAVLQWSGYALSYEITISGKPMVTTTVTNLPVNGLEFNTPYNITIVGINSIGRSPIFSANNIILIDVYLPELSVTAITSTTCVIGGNYPAEHSLQRYLAWYDINDNLTDEILITYTSGSVYAPPKTSQGRYELRVVGTNAVGKSVSTAMLPINLAPWTLTAAPRNLPDGYYYDDTWARLSTNALIASNPESALGRDITVTTSSNNYTTSSLPKPYVITLTSSLSNIKFTLVTNGIIKGTTVGNWLTRANYAMRVNSSCTVVIYNYGTICGRGGAGGQGGSSLYWNDYNGENGVDGGDAIFNENYDPPLIIYNYGTLACGGGGGAGGGGGGSDSKAIFGTTSYKRTTTHVVPSLYSGGNGTSGKARGGSNGTGGIGTRGGDGIGGYGSGAYSEFGSDPRESTGGTGGEKGLAVAENDATIYNFNTYYP